MRPDGAWRGGVGGPEASDVSSALQHFLERAAAERLPSFDAWFPSTFDYQRLCAELPAMAAATGTPFPPESGDESDLEPMVRAVFRGAHLITLAVLAAGADAAVDPETLLDHLTEAPGEEEEEAFTALADDALAAVEEDLAGGPGAAPADDPDAVERAAALFRATAAAVEHVLSSDPGRFFERAASAAPALWALVRVASILAAFRWMAAEQVADDWPHPAFDE